MLLKAMGSMLLSGQTDEKTGGGTFQADVSHEDTAGGEIHLEWTTDDGGESYDYRLTRMIEGLGRQCVAYDFGLSAPTDHIPDETSYQLSYGSTKHNFTRNNYSGSHSLEEGEFIKAQSNLARAADNVTILEGWLIQDNPSEESPDTFNV